MSWGHHGALPAPGHRVQLGPGPKADGPSLGKAASSAWPLSEVGQGLCHCAVSDRMPSSLPCLPPVFRPSVAVSPSVCVCVCVCLCLRARARLSARLHLPLAVFESVSEPPSLCASVSPDTRPPGPSSGPGLSQVAGVWLWLTSLRRPACLTWRGCVRVSVCLSVCLPVARLLSQEGPVLGGRRGGKWGLDRAKGRG